jgi:cell division protein FtsI/penicillin-binding protein 2
VSKLALASASGLRLASAFVLVGLVFGLVGLKAAKISLLDRGEQPLNLTQDPAPKVHFDLVDRNGTPLALSIERLELEMSPNAMWQAHTPDKMAAALSEALGPGHPPRELLERMLGDAKNGIVRVDRPPFLMNATQADAVWSWALSGSTERPAGGPAIPGLTIVPTDHAGVFALDWRPELVLSEHTRRAQGCERALDWSRKIADELYVCLYGRDALENLGDDEARSAARRKIWNALLPCQYKSIVKEVSPESAIALYELLKRERVREHQMCLVRNAKRMYPVQSGSTLTPPLSVLGRWGTLEPEQARERARRKLGLSEDEALDDRERDELERETRVAIYQPSPMSGLEFLCDGLLARPEWSFLEKRSEQYTFLANQVPRQPLQRYFQELIPASETPHVVTTLDLPLQRHVRQCLDQVMAEHDPALAMAIAIEVATGKVLAVDATDAYGIGGFLPTMHTFTPGSTMKAIVMATALDAGVVRLDEKIDTFDGNFHVGSRRITEAENQKQGWLTPAEGLAYSCNAVLVQIGLRIPAEFFHDHLVALGYGQYPKTGLGGERKGYLTPLPWDQRNDQASTSFGYQTMVTLWQQATALATVVRGGELRPLTLVESVEQNGVRHPVAVAEPTRVFSTESCAIVRDMMQLGAREGTGKKVYCPDIVMGTKTGTAQKTPTELCLHVELEHVREHGCRSAGACRRLLVGKKAHPRSCYTSSMCAWGHLRDDDREVMVLVVVDEARGGKKYGADVAGKAAVSILLEGLGFTRGGVPALAHDDGSFAPLSSEPAIPPTHAAKHAPAADVPVRLPAATDQPWAEDER